MTNTAPLSPTLTLPDGLSYLIISVPVEAGAVDMSGFLDAVRQETNVTGGDGISHFSLMWEAGGGGSVSVRSHEGQATILEITIFRQARSHGLAAERLESLIESAFANAPELTGTVYANFWFQTGVWRTRMPFPLPLPGVADTAEGGIPQLMGIELTFPNPSFALRRIGVTMDSSGGNFTVTQSVELPVSGPGLFRRVCAALSEHLNLLAERVAPDAESELPKE